MLFYQEKVKSSIFMVYIMFLSGVRMKAHQTHSLYISCGV
uniref:Uncharacterized protein n=1 Tax=Anguilla anguilla TaxID=7936 RepID=A0A0E9XCM3_ANGAN